MARPRIRRRLNFNPEVVYFKPRGVPLRLLEEVVLSYEEIEALKLHDVDGLDQIRAAEKMGISQPTFGRTLNNSYRKIAEGIIKGKAIKIKKMDL